MTTPQLTNAIDMYARRHGLDPSHVRKCAVLLEAAKREWRDGR